MIVKRAVGFFKNIVPIKLDSDEAIIVKGHMDQTGSIANLNDDIQFDLKSSFTNNLALDNKESVAHSLIARESTTLSQLQPKTAIPSVLLNIKALNIQHILDKFGKSKILELSCNKSSPSIETCASPGVDSGQKVRPLYRKKRLSKKFIYRTNKKSNLGRINRQDSTKTSFCTDKAQVDQNLCPKALFINLENKNDMSIASALVNDGKKALVNNQSMNWVFGELRFFLKMVFNLDFTNLVDITLDYNQLRIIAAIINKKFLIDFPFRSLYGMDSFKSLCNVKTGKRPEESYKFVFKHAYKHLKQQFRNRNLELSKLGFNDLNLQFYKYYFQEASDKLGISINQFFLPLTPDSYCNKAQKAIAQTINVSYITLVCQSPHFMNDFMTYVNDYFIRDYSEMITVKVNNICDKWELIFLETFGNEKMISFICEYIHTNKKCKLPWTIKEVEFAVDVVNKLVQKCKKRTWVKSKCFEKIILRSTTN